MGPLRIRHLARTKRNALGGKGFGGNISSHMAGRSLPFQCFHSPVRFLFVSFPSHEKSADLCSWALLRPWLSTSRSAFTSLVVGSGLHWACITHCTTICAILTIDDLKKKGTRVDPDLALGFSLVLRSEATASCRRLSFGGIPRCTGADFVHGKMDGMHVWSTASSSTFEAFPRTRAFVFTLPWLFCILASQVFNFFSSDRHCSSDKFSFGSSWRVFFFHLCLLSFSVLSSKERLHIRLVLFGNTYKTYQHQSVGKRWNESPFSLPAEQLAHPNMYTQQVLTILTVLTGHRLALWRSTEKHDESSALATQCETPCATRLSYHGICTILRAIRTIYVIRKGPIPTEAGDLVKHMSLFHGQ